MSQPNIPNIDPSITIDREDAINLILSSIAMEEMGLSHILNAEGEKLQYVLGTIPGLTGPPATIQDLLAINQSVRNTLDSATKNQMFLQSKMESALNASVIEDGGTGAVGPTGPIGPTGATGPTGPPSPGGSIPSAVYDVNLSAEDSSYEVIVGNVIFEYQYSTSSSLALSIRSVSVPILIDLKRSTQYDGGVEGYTRNDYTLTTTPLAEDTLIFSESRESNRTWLRQQDPVTGLWSLHEINIFSSASGARTTVWVYLIAEGVSFP